MGKYLLIIVLFLFVGCETPQEKNKKAIENLQQQLTSLEEKSYKIDDLEYQLKEIKKRQDIIQNTINDNKILAKLSLLDNKLKQLKIVSPDVNESLKVNIENLQKKYTLLEQKLNKLKLNSNNTDLSEIQKLKEEIQKLKQKSDTFDYIVIKPTTLITIKDVNIYEKPNLNSKIVKKWPKQTTFTSYKEKNGFIKVTGYFVHNKWTQNNESWWIKKENCKIKILGE